MSFAGGIDIAVRLKKPVNSACWLAALYLNKLFRYGLPSSKSLIYRDKFVDLL